MDLTAMRAAFNSYTSDLSSDLSDSEIDEYLNRAYRDRIPAEIDGELFKGIWSLTCTASTESYAFPREVLGVKARGVYIDSSATGGNLSSIHWLDVETDWDVWNRDDRHFPPIDGLPNSICFYGRTAYLSPRPSTDYIVQIPARIGPSSGLASTGLDDSNHAMAVVASGAIEFLLSVGNRESAADISELYSAFVASLGVKSNAQHNHRRPNRSF